MARPATFRSRLYSLIAALPGGPPLLRRFSSREPRPGFALISFPKSGRTWLRLLVAKYLQLHFDLPEDELLVLDRPFPSRPEVPRIRVSHDGYAHDCRPDELVTDKAPYRNQKVMLLVRDPRDVIVSLYFQRTRREDNYEGGVSEFVREEHGSLATMLRWYNIWAENRSVPTGFSLTRYEKLHADTAGELRRLLDFLGIDPVSEAALDATVEFAAFDNMRKLESDRRLGSKRLEPGDDSDPESFKTRRGIVGGYGDYLTPEDLTFVNRMITRELSPFFGFYRAPQ